ncbi:phosphotransferase [Brevibacterium jeotgali]|uniref:Predicted kinase, aminoglycoside phosphotransferase (APT) family n=1 Tax=Brevibacterium jeotgali TaxID=1262550 RepID=A0A2H1L4S7_9MICO|nr:phosphotransferase [Brevibacterium jeotgali]TWC01525.1 aminoglycoside phosphotransferase (APT) family kinase protein [Brevibacterium jeotgali]SMY11869.1 Predicted kinase, aminoglycoside phosphotransferase (APT) family [Brevibacterium jeotgali]
MRDQTPGDDTEARDPHPYDVLLTRAFGASAAVTALAPVSKGASKRIEIIEASVAGAPQRAVLRAEPTDDADPTGMEREAAAFRAAGSAGVPVPEVLLADTGDGPIAAPHLITSFVEGESLPRRILRTFDREHGHDGEAFAQRLGEIAARVHRAEVPDGLFDVKTDELEDWRAAFSEYGVDSPAFELAFSQLADSPQPDSAPTFVHGDLRMGNLMVRDGRVAAVLDWELAHIGDPVSDLGWLCAVQWRFGGPGEAAGVGSRDALLRGYREAGGRPVAEAAVRWWEILSIVKWGVMCLRQAARADAEPERALELALIGRRFAECEADVLDALGVDLPTSAPTSGGGPTSEVSATSATETMVRGLEESFGQAYDGRMQKAALDTVLRDVQHGPALRDASSRALAAAGFATERELAEAVRTGAVDTDDPQVRVAVVAPVLERITLSNPRHLQRIADRR